MPRRDKAADNGKQKRQARTLENSNEPKGTPRPEGEARAWAAANKVHDGGKKMGSRRKLPSGPIGGSGRKTNLARSS